MIQQGRQAPIIPGTLKEYFLVCLLFLEVKISILQSVISFPGLPINFLCGNNDIHPTSELSACLICRELGHGVNVASYMCS